jgi:hypothetical protein
VAEKRGSLLAAQKRVRIFRAVGAPDAPFEQIAAFTPAVAATKICSLGAPTEE